VESKGLTGLIVDTILRDVAMADMVTGYREPLVGFASAADPRFDELRRIVPDHLSPEQMLPGARSVISFFLPFAAWVVEANARESEVAVAEWSTAYVETNALIGRIVDHVTELLAGRGVRAAAAAATHNYDPDTLTCPWSHKSVAVIAGLGSFGLHRMVITDAGCAGRFGSLVISAGLTGGAGLTGDAELPAAPAPVRERCRYFYDGSCAECVSRCPVEALSEDNGMDKQRCHRRLLEIAVEFGAKACGKCALGPCAMEPAV
jgi:epoxyqueuosine reductase